MNIETVSNVLPEGSKPYTLPFINNKGVRKELEDLEKLKLFILTSLNMLLQLYLF